MLTCLIGEADPFIARLLNRFAEESGLQATLAVQGEDLVKLARECLPGVIILEIELPGKLRGWEAFRLLKADPRTAGIPVISCSWSSGEAARESLGETCAHLQKPELYYPDFQAALRQAGIELENQAESASGSRPDEPFSHE
jgi:CheY-like chemotaxis protein